MIKRSILIIEDEKNLARFVSLELQHEGYHVGVAHDGKSGLKQALENDYDLILLDLMLPEMDGFEVTRRLQNEKDPYIIMMTARDSVIDVVAGLDRGADGYIIKPFAIEELLARVRAVFRRIEKDPDKQILPGRVTYRDLVLDEQNRGVSRGGEFISLSKREYKLLEVLLHNVNKIMSREELLARVWNFTEDPETNVVDVYIRYLRSKIDIPQQESYIQTVRGLGYAIRD